MQVKQILNAAIGSFGYEINNLRHRQENNDGFTQYKIVKLDGSFDYEEYRRIQTWKNKRDIETVWVKEPNIKFISEHLLNRFERPPKFGICHGTKRGNEQAWFRKYLGCEVIGTDISDTAGQFPNTIQWDFHEVKPEWQNGVDFIYSNSLDHSYDPEKCINAWMSCVRPGGYCIIEWHVQRVDANLTDPFGCDIMQLVYAITNWGRGSYCVRETLPVPENPEYIRFVVLYKFIEGRRLS